MRWTSGIDIGSYRQPSKSMCKTILPPIKTTQQQTNNKQHTVVGAHPQNLADSIPEHKVSIEKTEPSAALLCWLVAALLILFFFTVLYQCKYCTQQFLFSITSTKTQNSNSHPTNTFLFNTIPFPILVFRSPIPSDSNSVKKYYQKRPTIRQTHNQRKAFIINPIV